MKKNNKSTQWYFIALIGILMLVFFDSCAVKKVGYFADLPIDSLRIVQHASAFTEPVIQEDDILNVTIQTIDPTSAMATSQTTAETASNGTGTQAIVGYLVDKNGLINIPMIGKVEVKGMTTHQARERITQYANQYYRDPTVQVRFANYKITVLGEVARPATYTVPNEKVTVLDALGLAGDLTIYGKRENVLLIRDHEGKKEMIRLNLYSSEIFQSPYFYLRQNDVIYVEPGKSKAAANNAARTQTFALISTLASLLAIVLTRF